MKTLTLALVLLCSASCARSPPFTNSRCEELLLAQQAAADAAFKRHEEARAVSEQNPTQANQAAAAEAAANAAGLAADAAADIPGCPAPRRCGLTIHSSRSRFAARLNSGVRPAMTVQLGWLWDENLQPFLEFVAGSVGYDLAPAELAAYVSEVRASDAEQDAWCRIPLHGCTLHLARDAGTFVVHAKADGPGSLTAELRGVVAFLACYSAVARA